MKHMPWRLIGFIIILTIFIIFSGFNTHHVTVNFGPKALENIPMFMALFVAFLLGSVLTLPFSILSMVRKKKGEKGKRSNKKLSGAEDKVKALPENPPAVEEDGKHEDLEPEPAPVGNSKRKKKK